MPILTNQYRILASNKPSIVRWRPKRGWRHRRREPFHPQTVASTPDESSTSMLHLQSISNGGIYFMKWWNSGNQMPCWRWEKYRNEKDVCAGRSSDFIRKFLAYTNDSSGWKKIFFSCDASKLSNMKLKLIKSKRAIRRKKSYIDTVILFVSLERPYKLVASANCHIGLLHSRHVLSIEIFIISNCLWLAIPKVLQKVPSKLRVGCYGVNK